MIYVDELVEFKEYGRYFKEYRGKKYIVKATSYNTNGSSLIEDVETGEMIVVDILWLTKVKE